MNSFPPENIYTGNKYFEYVFRDEFDLDSAISMADGIISSRAHDASTVILSPEESQAIRERLRSSSSTRIVNAVGSIDDVAASAASRLGSIWGSTKNIAAKGVRAAGVVGGTTLGVLGVFGSVTELYDGGKSIGTGLAELLDTKATDAERVRGGAYLATGAISSGFATAELFSLAGIAKAGATAGGGIASAGKLAAAASAGLTALAGGALAGSMYLVKLTADEAAAGKETSWEYTTRYYGETIASEGWSKVGSDIALAGMFANQIVSEWVDGFFQTGTEVGPGADAIKTQETVPVISRALNLWEPVLQSPGVFEVGIKELPGAVLAETQRSVSESDDRHVVWLDPDAAGVGWAVDRIDEPKYDLLTVLAHEIGHTLGLSHPDESSTDGTQVHSVMDAYLAPGVQRFPSEMDFHAVKGILQRPNRSLHEGMLDSGDPNSVESEQVRSEGLGPSVEYLATASNASVEVPLTISETTGSDESILEPLAVPPHSRSLRIDVTGLELLQSSQSPPDAFALGIFDGGSGQPFDVVDSLTVTDSLLNIQADGTVFAAAGVTNADGGELRFDQGSLPTTVSIDVSSIPAGTELLLSFDLLGFGEADSSVTISDIRFESDTTDGEVVGRHLFYNDSVFDGSDQSINAMDDTAIAPDKVPLLAGQQATFENYSGYWRGINGIFIDVQGMPGTPTVDDFEFRIGNDSDLATWQAAPAPLQFLVRGGEGAGGSDRIAMTWGHHDIANKWLEVRILANERTGLAADDVFYWGSAVGDTGDSAFNTFVDVTDSVRIEANFRDFLNPAPLDDPFDLNRDRFVDATDFTIVVDNQTNFLSDLNLIQPSDTSSNFDVSEDGDVSPLDALLVINHLSRVANPPLAESDEGFIDGDKIGVNAVMTDRDFLDTYDVDGNGSVSPLDALKVINLLSRRQNEAKQLGRDDAIERQDSAPADLVFAEMDAATALNVDESMVQMFDEDHSIGQ